MNAISKSALIMAFALTAQAQAAETATIAAGVEVDVPSRFVSRAAPLTAGPALQPSAWLEAEGLTATGWASFDAGAERGAPAAAGRPTDVTAALAYTLALGPAEFSPSFTYMSFPGLSGAPDSGEAALDLRLGGESAALCGQAAIDVAAARGATYLRLGLCGAAHLPGGLSAEAELAAAGGNAALGAANFGVTVGGLHAAEAAAALVVPLDAVGEGLYARLHGGVSHVVAPNLAARVAEPTLAFGALAFGAEL